METQNENNQNFVNDMSDWQDGYQSGRRDAKEERGEKIKLLRWDVKQLEARLDQMQPSPQPDNEPTTIVGEYKSGLDMHPSIDPDAANNDPIHRTKDQKGWPPDVDIWGAFIAWSLKINKREKSGPTAVLDAWIACARWLKTYLTGNNPINDTK